MTVWNSLWNYLDSCLKGSCRTIAERLQDGSYEDATCATYGGCILLKLLGCFWLPAIPPDTVAADCCNSHFPSYSMKEIASCRLFCVWIAKTRHLCHFLLRLAALQDEEGFVNPDFFWQDSQKHPYWKAACTEDTFSGSRVQGIITT